MFAKEAGGITALMQGSITVTKNDLVTVEGLFHE
jgi:hypothetical protein